MKIPLIFYLMPYIFHIIFVYLQYKRINNNNTNERKPLKDIIFDNSYHFENSNFISDFLLLIFILPYFNKNGIIAFKYFIKFFSIVVCIRIITSTITDIPSSDPNCQNNIKELSLKNYIFGHCFDKIFSGHTALTLSLILTLQKFNLLGKNKILFLYLFQILYVYFFLICTRDHYSVDVILSYIIVIPLFISLQDDL